MKISACVISFNEEDRIGPCLESLAGIADEIVVVDSHSTDGTREIARRHAHRVIEQPFLGYVAQKNFAVEQAAHGWILSLDCDERISATLREELLRVKHAPTGHAAYEMQRRTYHVDQWIDHCWYPDRKIRLFDRTRAHWTGREPHDSVRVEEGTVGRLRGDILHYSFRSLSEHLQTLDRFSEIGARALYDEGRRVSVLTPIGRSFARFVKMYLVKRGFLDGFAGLVVSVLSAVTVFTKYSKLVYLQRSEERQR